MKKRNIVWSIIVSAVLLLATCAKAAPLPPAAPQSTAPSVTTSPPNYGTSPVTTLPVTTPPAVTPPVTTTPVTTAPPTVAAPGPNEVWAQGYSFNPNVLAVPVGTTVIWTNKDDVEHTVTSDNGSFSGGDLAGSFGTCNNTFTVPGTYSYHCAIHYGMVGTIIVK